MSLHDKILHLSHSCKDKWYEFGENRDAYTTGHRDARHAAAELAAEADAALASANERIATLEALLGGARLERQLWEDNYNRVAAERDALRANAERYQVLRNRDHGFVVEQDRPGWRTTLPVGRGLDEAIDNERSKA